MTDFTLLDGAMGTLYQSLYGEGCFEANLNFPERIAAIHQAYAGAGSQVILTNTFDASRLLESGGRVLEGVRAACEIAADIPGVLVMGDLGPGQPDVWKAQVEIMLAAGVEAFLFETLSSADGLAEMADFIRQRCPEALIGVSFAVGADGMSRQGYGVNLLLEEAVDIPGIDIVGLNCLSSAYHMANVLPSLDLKGRKLLVMPNSGYPRVVGHKVVYDGSPDYFARQCVRMKARGAVWFGGCCGTTPDHIRALKEQLASVQVSEPETRGHDRPVFHELGFLGRLKASRKKIVAVELDPPANDDVAGFMRGLGLLKEAGADIITIADNPIGRPRADSALLACKIRRETGMEVLPHLTCRDRNLNALKGLLLGLSIEDVHQVLVITGDPLPDEARQEVRSVYDFNSRKLAGYISCLNESLFSSKMHVLGALDLNARNFEVQMRLAKEKLDQGMEGFLTQPVLSQGAWENLKKFRQTFPDCLILAGIFPVVSYRNGLFLDSEVNGVHVCREILDLYKDKDRAQGEELAYRISREIMGQCAPYCDGYYLMTPFQRVSLVCKILEDVS